MKNKKTILILTALVLVVALMAGAYFLTRPQAVAGGKNITVTVVHADGTEKVFDLTTQEEYLGPVLLSEGIAQGVEGPYGLEIHEVDGERAVWDENGAYWAIFVNGEYGMTGVDTTPVNDGDVFKLEFTRG